MNTTQEHEALVLNVSEERFVGVLSYDRHYNDEVVCVSWRLFSVVNVDGAPEVFLSDSGPTWGFTRAQVLATGHVKWDGCHEFEVETYHGCSPKAASTRLTHSEFDWVQTPESTP